MKLDNYSILLFLIGVLFSLIVTFFYYEINSTSYVSVKSTLQEVESICKNFNSTPKSTQIEQYGVKMV